MRTRRVVVASLAVAGRDIVVQIFQNNTRVIGFIGCLAESYLADDQQVDLSYNLNSTRSTT
jgi:hypothetical protein